MVDFTGLPLPTPDVEERLEKLDRRAVSAISAADFPGYEDFLLDPANDPKPHLRQQLQRRNDCEGQALATGVEASAQKLGLPAVQYSDIFAYQASEYRDRGGRVGADQGASISAGVEVLTQGLPGICGPGLPTEADWAYQTYTRSQREFEQRARSVELESGLITEHYKAPPFREALVVMAAGGRIHWGTYWGLNWTRSRVVRRPVIKGRGDMLRRSFGPQNDLEPGLSRSGTLTGIRNLSTSMRRNMSSFETAGIPLLEPLLYCRTDPLRDSRPGKTGETPTPSRVKKKPQTPGAKPMVRALPPRDPHKWDLLVFAGFLVSLLACFAACTQSLRGDEISVPVDRDAFKGGEVESQDDRFPDPGKPGNPGSDNSPGYSYTVEPKDPKVQKSQAEAQRFPRSIMVTGPDCNPCRKMKLENPDLVGPGPTYPVQSLDYSRDDLSDYGISPSIIIQVPTFVILEAPGTLHKLPTGAVCKHVGGKSREKLEEYLTHETHKVSLEPWTEAPMDPEDCRTVCSIQSSSNLFAALEGHLARCAGAPEPVVGSLFDINFEGPGSLRYPRGVYLIPDIQTGRSHSDDAPGLRDFHGLGRGGNGRKSLETHPGEPEKKRVQRGRPSLLHFDFSLWDPFRARTPENPGSLDRGSLILRLPSNERESKTPIPRAPAGGNRSFSDGRPGL